MSIHVNFDRCYNLLDEKKERSRDDWVFICEVTGNLMGGMLTPGNRATMFMLMDGRPCRQATITDAIDMAPGTVNKYLNHYYLPKGLIRRTQSNRYEVECKGFQRWIKHLWNDTKQEPLVPMVTVKPTVIKGEITLTVKGALAQLIIELNKDPEFLNRRLCEFLLNYDEDDKTTIRDRFNQLYNVKRSELVTAFMIYMIKTNRRDMIEYWAENCLSVEDLNPGWLDGLIDMIEVDYSKPY